MTFKKQANKKKFIFHSNFFFTVFPNPFSLGLLANRFRLVDLGGVEPLRKLLRQKLVPAKGNKKSLDI